MTEKELEMYEVLVEWNIATEDEIGLVKMVASGTWSDILTGILFARVGYTTLEQLFEAAEGAVF